MSKKELVKKELLVLIHIRLRESMIKKIDDLVKKGLVENRAHLIRCSVKKFLEEYK